MVLSISNVKLNSSHAMHFGLRRKPVNPVSEEGYRRLRRVRDLEQQAIDIETMVANGQMQRDEGIAEAGKLREQLAQASRTLRVFEMNHPRGR